MEKVLGNLTDTEIKNNIGERITKFEYDNNKTDGYIAEKVNASRPTVTQWRNKNGVPKNYSQLVDLSIVLGCTVDELLYGNDISKEAVPIIEELGLTKKTAQILKNSKIPTPIALFGKEEHTPSFNRLVNYLICKNTDIVIGSDKGDIGIKTVNMLKSIFKEANDYIKELKNIIYKNKEYQEKTYKELTGIKNSIPTKLKMRIDSLPEIIQKYIEDEIDKKVDDIIGVENN